MTLARRPKVFETVLSALGKVAPLQLAAKWDNVGLLVDTVKAEYPDPFVVFLTNDLTEKVRSTTIGRAQRICASSWRHLPGMCIAWS